MSSLRFIRSAVAATAAAALVVTFIASGGAGEPAVYATLMGLHSDAPRLLPAQAAMGEAPVATPPAPLFAGSAVDHRRPADEAVATVPPDGTLLRPVAIVQHAETAHKTRTAGRSLAAESLAGEIQRNLKRLGCYSGPLTGDWDAATRAGMSELVKARNARLSVKQADVSLLALASAHDGTRCGSVVAARKAGETGEHRAVRPEPMPGLMAIGGPRVETGSLGTSASPEPGASVAQHAPPSANAGVPPPNPAIAARPTARPRGEAASRRHFRRNSDTFFTHPLSRTPDISP